MSNKFMSLQIGDLSLRFNRFFDEMLPRVDAEGQDEGAQITASGSVVVQGVDFDNISLWNVAVYCSENDFDTLCLMRVESKYRRQNNLDPGILVIDKTQKHRERGPRTRALAPNTGETIRGPYVLYYPQYRVIMPRQPEGKLTGRGFTANFTLIEIERIAA